MRDIWIVSYYEWPGYADDGGVVFAFDNAVDASNFRELMGGRLEKVVCNPNAELVLSYLSKFIEPYMKSNNELISERTMERMKKIASYIESEREKTE